MSNKIDDILTLWKSQDSDPRYIATKEVASRVRTLVRLAKQEWILPQDLKVSVRSDYSSVMIRWSIGSTNRISENPIYSLDKVDGKYQFTRTNSYKAIEEYLRHIAEIWQLDNSNPMIDFFDINYYVRVAVDYELTYNIKNTISKELNFEELETFLLLYNDDPYNANLDNLVSVAKSLASIPVN